MLSIQVRGISSVVNFPSVSIMFVISGHTNIYFRFIYSSEALTLSCSCRIIRPIVLALWSAGAAGNVRARNVYVVAVLGAKAHELDLPADLVGHLLGHAPNSPAHHPLHAEAAHAAGRPPQRGDSGWRLGDWAGHALPAAVEQSRRPLLGRRGRRRRRGVYRPGRLPQRHAARRRR